MKSSVTSTLLFMLLFGFGFCSYAQQLPVKIVAGNLLMDDGSMVLNKAKYTKILDSISKAPHKLSADTNRLFKTALLYDLLNDLLAKPYAGEKTALANLKKGKDSVEKAIRLGMGQFNVLVLRAQIYRELCYRFSADESWMFNAQIMAGRRKEFDSYKALANKYYDEIESMEKKNASDYEKLKVTYNYPVK